MYVCMISDNQDKVEFNSKANALDQKENIKYVQDNLRGIY